MAEGTQALIEPAGTAGQCPWQRHKGLLAVALVAVLAFYTRSWEGDLDGDPVHYAAIAKCVLSTGDWLSMHDGPGAFYGRKPPMMFWLVALNFKLLGVSTYAARFWSCAFGVGVCLLTYLVGRRLFSETAGLLAGLMMATLPGVLSNFVNLRLESALTFFTLLAVYGALRAAQDDRPRWLLLAGLAAGLGMMVKPSGALLVVVFCGLLLAVRRPRLLIHPYALGAVALAAAIIAPWYLTMTARHGDEFIGLYFGDWRLPMIQRQAGTSSHFVRNVAAYLAGMSWRALPWWPLGAYALVRRRQTGPQERAGMLVAVLWILAVVALMAVPAMTYHRYMIPAYPAVALLAGWGLCSLLSERARARVPGVAVGLALAFSCLVAIVPVPLHGYKCKGFADARPLLDRLSPGATIATCTPDEPPGPSQLPEEWMLRSCAVYYLDRGCINYGRPKDVASAGERFVIARGVDRDAFKTLGYEPLVRLDSKYWLFDQGPVPLAWPKPS